MKIHYSLTDFYAKNPVVTIGMFDGVHAGHRTILQQLEVEKQQIQGESVVLTFWPHPQMVFHKTEGFKILTTLEEKLELLSQTGLDHCIILPFTLEFSQLSPEEYITEILHIGIGAKKIILGYDHRYGKKGAGDFALMQTMGKTLGFSVDEIPAYTLEHINVSSTKIRNALHEGNVEKAKLFLTYNYSLQGIVAQGKQIGRTIGIPTANIIPESEYKIIPALGVYIALVKYNNTIHQAVASIGLNPTIDAENQTASIEAHIFNFSEDIYSHTIRIFFLHKLRNEKRYNSLEELKKAIEQDISEAQQFFLHQDYTA